MNKEDELSNIVDSLVKDGLEHRNNKVQVFKNFGQMDPQFLLDEFVFLGMEDVEEFTNNERSDRMRGYSANIIREKSKSNRIYWSGNDEVAQNYTHFLGRTLVDNLALKTDEGIEVYMNFGQPINKTTKPQLITDKAYEAVLQDLKNATSDTVSKVIESYNQKASEKGRFRGFSPLELKEMTVEQNRNYDLTK